MEFPSLGKKCTAESCNLHDFLPYTCVYCHKVYCQDHFKLQAHNCPSLEDPNHDVRVPVCPICEKPVPVKRGMDPNIRMNEHIQKNCSDLEPKTDNTCRKKGCPTKMLVPMVCPECGLSFCVKHRLAIDHQCQGKPVKQTFKFGSSKPTTSSSKPIPSSSQKSKADIEREREARNKTIARLQAKAKSGSLTEQEQLTLARLLSLRDQDKNGKCIIC